jgi:cell division transport system permease protein
VAKRNSNKFRGTVISTVMGMSLLLFLLGLLAFVGVSWMNFEKEAKKDVSVDIYFRDIAREVDVLKMEKELLSEPGVSMAKYVSPDSAKALLMQNLGEESFDILDGSNPLKSSINVKFEMAYVNVDSVKKFKERVLQGNEVLIESVDYNEKQFMEVSNKFLDLRTPMYIIAGILLFISVSLIFFTIRLAVFSKRFTIRTMQLVGAKSSFIRRPFLMNAIAQGFVAGMIAVLLILGFGYILKESGQLSSWVINLVSNQEVFKENMMIYGMIFAGMVILGIFISFFATYFALNKYIWVKTDKLY